MLTVVPTRSTESPVEKHMINLRKLQGNSHQLIAVFFGQLGNLGFTFVFGLSKLTLLRRHSFLHELVPGYFSLKIARSSELNSPELSN